MEIVNIQKFDIYKDLNLEKICIFCLKEDGKIVNIFETGDVNIVFKIMACTAIELNSFDSVPKCICHDCRVQLERFYFFRKRAQNSYNKIKKHIRLLLSGKTSNTFTKSDDIDDDLDFEYTSEFLKAVEQEEKQKFREEHEKDDYDFKKDFHIDESNHNFNDKSDYDKSIAPISLEDFHEDHADEIIIDESKIVENDSIEEGISLNHLEEQNSEKMLSFTYSSTNDNELEEYYLINNEASKIDDLQKQNILEDSIESETNMIDIENLQNNHNLSHERNETMNLDDCSLSAQSNRESVFSENDDQDAGENDLDETLNSLIEEVGVEEHVEDENSNQSQLALATLVKKSLLTEENYKLNGNVKFKLQNVSDELTYVKVLTEEGNVIDFEVQSECDVESLIEKTVSSEGMRIFKCNLCPQTFTRRPLLLRHKTVHVKSTGYSCKFCKKWFACKSSLNRHIRVHTGEKPFECEKCGRKFIQKEILKRHMVLHTGIRPYPCTQCDKSFVQKQLLRQHVNLKHTSNPVVEMHECFLCPKTFYHASGLSRHLLVHSGVSYQCKMCGKKFNDKSAVKRHTLTVHSKTKIIKIEGDLKNDESNLKTLS